MSTAGEYRRQTDKQEHKRPKRTRKLVAAGTQSTAATLFGDRTGVRCHDRYVVEGPAAHLQAGVGKELELDLDDLGIGPGRDVDVEEIPVLVAVVSATRACFVDPDGLAVDADLGLVVGAVFYVEPAAELEPGPSEAAAVDHFAHEVVGDVGTVGTVGVLNVAQVISPHVVTAERVVGVAGEPERNAMLPVVGIGLRIGIGGSSGVGMCPASLAVLEVVEIAFAGKAVVDDVPGQGGIDIAREVFNAMDVVFITAIPTPTTPADITT